MYATILYCLVHTFDGFEKDKCADRERQRQRHRYKNISQKLPTQECGETRRNPFLSPLKGAYTPLPKKVTVPSQTKNDVTPPEILDREKKSPSSD